MIGNDIVDLREAAIVSNWKRRGFLEKLFNAEEQENILMSRNPQLYVWLLWSMKEAAYKAHQRKHNLERNYRPKNYSCTVFSSEDGSAEGKVECGDDIYSTQSTISSRYIHSIAYASEGKKITGKILPSSEDLKSTFILHFSEIENYYKGQISIKKDKHSIPHLAFKGHLIDCSFSFSHHGKYSAYALSLMNY